MQSKRPRAARLEADLTLITRAAGVVRLLRLVTPRGQERLLNVESGLR